MSSIRNCFRELSTLHPSDAKAKDSALARLIASIGPKELRCSRLLHKLEKKHEIVITPLEDSYLQEARRYLCRTLIKDSGIDIPEVNTAISELNDAISAHDLQLVTIRDIPRTAGTDMPLVRAKVDEVMRIYRTLGIENAWELWFYNWSSLAMDGYNNQMLSF
jgi:hypothetical protein